MNHKMDKILYYYQNIKLTFKKKKKKTRSFTINILRMCYIQVIIKKNNNLLSLTEFS